MSIVIVTGSAGLIGSEAALYFCQQGYTVVGIDNNMRAEFFGPDASTEWNRKAVEEVAGEKYIHHAADIRSESEMANIFSEYGNDIRLIIHAAAQPSHDWAATAPIVDFTVNASGTLNLLEQTRQHATDAVFIFCSTNKVYGDRPNELPLIEHETRFEIPETHEYRDGIDESMSIDQSKHSLFGASKVAADILVQEYGRYFGMKTAIFRGGCLTGPNHSGTRLHGFLSYLMKCTMTSEPYQVFGYQGKQVRDNIHSYDLITAFDEVFRAPRIGEVYNIGGSRFSNCSMREAIAICEELTGKKLDHTYVESNRIGDHIWWISDTRKFRTHYPEWRQTYSVRDILQEIIDSNHERWTH